MTKKTRLEDKRKRKQQLKNGIIECGVMVNDDEKKLWFVERSLKKGATEQI